MLKLDASFAQGQEQIVKIAKALGSETRLRILALLEKGPSGVTALAKELGISQPAATQHIQALEDAGLVASMSSSDSSAGRKLCRRTFDEISLRFPVCSDKGSLRTKTVSMPVGAFSRIVAAPPCGMAGEARPIGLRDDARVFSSPERFQARTLFFRDGFVEYEFPREVPAGVMLRDVVLSMEISSEASLPVGVNECPSDISVWINDVRLGTWTCPGFFTGVRGRYTPSWVQLTANQFGLLKTWRISEEGVLLDGIPLSRVKFTDLRLFDSRTIKVRIGIADDATFKGGLNIFGKGFGNYAQDILLEINYLV